MTTLTDRYVWAVLRGVPEGQRKDLEPEIRALVADAVEAQDAGGLASDAAERAALIELGDPDALAARYTDRTRFLIGPGVYPTWSRMLTLLVPLVAVVSAVASMAAAAFANESTVGAVLTAGIGTAIYASIQTVFWFTLVFAVLERVGGPMAASSGEVWTPDRLPDVPAPRSMSAVDCAFQAIGLGFSGAFLVWQQLAKPIVHDGVSYPILDPALTSFWLPFLLVVIGLQIALTLVRYARGRWTWPIAIANAVLAAAFALPVLWLYLGERLFDPGLLAVVEDLGLTDTLRPLVLAIIAGIVVVSAWEAVSGLLRAARESRAA
jgi:hypothetical protein